MIQYFWSIIIIKRFTWQEISNIKRIAGDKFFIRFEWFLENNISWKEKRFEKISCCINDSREKIYHIFKKES